jgi:hypothetical protein
LSRVNAAADHGVHDLAAPGEHDEVGIRAGGDDALAPLMPATRAGFEVARRTVSCRSQLGFVRLTGFFAPQLLDAARVLVLRGVRIENPPDLPDAGGHGVR